MTEPAHKPASTRCSRSKPQVARVELVPHRPEWVGEAAQEARRLADTLGDLMAEIHHIGSPSVPGLLAKPVLDFLPLVRSLGERDEDRSNVGELGYEWRGGLRVPGPGGGA